MYEMEGKRAIVTGGAQGIGRAIAMRLSEEGCSVGLIDMDFEGAERTVQEIVSLGRTALAVGGDVTNHACVETQFPKLIKELGGVDILINNAGVLKLSRILDMDIADWRKTFDVNVNGMFLCSQAVLPSLIAQGSGKIVNLASWMGKQGVENYGAYCASKSATISMTQTLALEVAPHGINVNAVCPGLIVNTQMREDSDKERQAKGMLVSADRAPTIPLRRVGYPEDVARVAVFLTTEEASYMTGQAINVTGGMWMN